MTRKSIKKSVAARYFHDFMRKYWDATAEGDIITFPRNLGAVQVKEGKTPYGTEHMRIDWVSTKKFWKENPEAKQNKQFLYFDNLHTEGRYVKGVYKRSRIRDWVLHWVYRYTTPRGAQIRYSKKFREGKRY
jgi:hypothetical protein